ncbi:MAG: NAD(P)/FAD-dependent oxidoreductase [Cyanobacteria bacterium P01_H01_bin.35]
MKPENSNPKIDYDVAIVGAGPVGLATALGLRQRGIENIIVLDQTRAFRKVGQTLGLAPNGLKALKYIDRQAYESIKETLQELKNNQEWITRNVNGEKMSSFLLGYDELVEQYGEGQIFLHWYDLQTRLRKLLPEKQVKPNHRCVNVVAEPEFQCVRADFVSNLGTEANPYSHWETPQEKDKTTTATASPFVESEITSIRAKVFIAADGINSTVRKVIYKDTPYNEYSKPTYSGFSVIQTTGAYIIPEALSQNIQEQFLSGSRVVTIENFTRWENSTVNKMPRIIVWSDRPSQFEYIIDAALPFDLLAGKSGKELIDIAVLELKKANFPEMIQQLVALSTPELMMQRSFYIHPLTLATPDKPKWSMGRVVLVGDAVHGMPPFIGQGVNQGFEDAAAIATLVAEINQQNQWDDTAAIETAFSKYEALRRPFMESVQQATLTRKPISSERGIEEFAQQVYSRNIAEIMQTLL